MEYGRKRCSYKFDSCVLIFTESVNRLTMISLSACVLDLCGIQYEDVNIAIYIIQFQIDIIIKLVT